MNERNFKTNANEVSDMLRTENNNYRRAFWIALTTTLVLAIVTLLLWWRLSHAGTASHGRPGTRGMHLDCHRGSLGAAIFRGVGMPVGRRLCTV